MGLLSKDSFAKKLAKALKGKDFTELARVSGVSQVRINELLTGQEPTMREIHKIAEAANVKAKPLTDAAMDDMAASSGSSPESKPARPVTSSPMQAKNNW